MRLMSSYDINYILSYFIKMYQVLKVSIITYLKLNAVGCIESTLGLGCIESTLGLSYLILIV